MTVKKLLSKALSKVLESEGYLGLSSLVDRCTLTFFCVALRDRNPVTSHALIVPTIGNGNLGDQAMFDAYLSNVRGNIVAIVNSEGDLQLTDLQKARVRIVPLRGLLTGWPFGRIRSRLRFLHELQGAGSLSIVGADIMDGGYSRRDSVLRSQLLIMAGKLGVPSQILGFSWNDRPNKVAQRALERASTHTLLNLRDPLSFERIQKTECSNIVLTADTVFALSGVAPAFDAVSWVDSQRLAGRRIAVLNTSGLLERRHDLDAEYFEVMRFLLAAGYAVVILPHVIRKGDNDLVPASRLKESFNNEAVLLVDRLWTPANVAWLASLSEIVVTGRMHLAILALGQGTPAVTLATQGKVEGMLKTFGLSDYAVEPGMGMAKKISELVSRHESDSSASRASILERVDDVSRHSMRNFALTEQFSAMHQ